MRSVMDPEHLGIDEPGGHPESSNGRALPRVLDPVMTMEVVRRYVESERVRNRRSILMLGAIFVVLVFLILSVSVFVGTYVLQNTRRAVDIADSMSAQTLVYAMEIDSFSNKMSRLEDGSRAIADGLSAIYRKRDQESSVLQSDLARFSKWVAANNQRDSQTLQTLEQRILELEGLTTAKQQELVALKQHYEGLLASLASRPPMEASSTEPGTAIVARQEDPHEAGNPDVVLGAFNDGHGDFSFLDGNPGDGTDIALQSNAREIAPAETSQWVEQIRVPGEISVVTFPNGDRYEGEFKAGLFHGWGSYYYAHGDRYEGEFRNDMKHGKGTFTYKNGGKYIGEFRNEMKHGRGTFLFANGDRYVGEFRDDLIHGKGSMTYMNGNKYAGDFKNGVRHGNGEMTFFNGDSYKGEFEGDMRQGRGIYLFSDGAKYIGEFLDGKRQGKGRYIYSGGGEYIGEFKDGKKDGKGKVVYPGGQEISGVWSNDKLMTAVR